MSKKRKQPENDWDELDGVDEVEEDEVEEVDDSDSWEEEDNVPETAAEEDAEEPAVEIDPEDPIEFPDQFYTVQETYETGGVTVKSGTDIQIKCGNCAAFDAPLKARDGKPLCRPGLPFILPTPEGEEERRWRMQEDRYSCQTHFIPKDMEDLLSYLTDDIDQVKMLLWSFPTISRLVQLQQRIRKYCAKRNEDPDKAINTVVDFMMLFSSEQQQELVKPFIKRVVDGLAASKKKKPGRRKQRFYPGDDVSWETAAGEKIEGFIRSIGGRGNLVTIIVRKPYVQILCPDVDQAAVQWQRPVEEWMQMNPQRIASTPVVTD